MRSTDVINAFTPTEVGKGRTGLDDTFESQVRMAPGDWGGVDVQVLFGPDWPAIDSRRAVRDPGDLGRKIASRDALERNDVPRVFTRLRDR